MTFESAVVGNLERLSVLQFIHPRLAVVAVGSELELLFLDILPPPFLGRLKDEVLSRTWMEFPAPTVIYKLVDSMRYKDALPNDVRDFCQTIFEQAKACRHERRQTTAAQAGEVIRMATAFVTCLKNVTEPYAFFCRTDHLHCPFSYRTALEAQVGQKLVLSCPKCEGVLASYKLDSSCEEPDLNIADYQNALSEFRRRNRTMLCEAFIDDAIEFPDYMKRVNSLEDAMRPF